MGVFRRAGYNVLTWDPRGFGQSGGTVQVDSPEYEGRDVQALIDYVARQPEAQLDRAGDPRVGMSGASYGGGIQLVTAAIDSRLDAIAPVIAWHSLVTSLYKAQSPKSGWGSALFALGVEGSTIPGIPAGETGNLDPHITSAYTSGLAYGQFSDEDVQWFAARGPGALVQRIRIPTLLIQGTVDTLFTLDEAITNYRILRANKVPTKMIWFCGGHGACLTDAGPARLRRGPDRELVRAVPEARQVGRDRSPVRVDRRRRPGAHRAGLPAGGAAGGLGIGCRAVRPEPRRASAPAR